MTKEELEKYDFYLLLDKSASMGTQDMSGGRTRWAAAQEAVLGLARKCVEYDKDGITVITFAGGFKEYHNITGAEDRLKQIWKENEPNGSTDTTKVFEHVFNRYFTEKKKPIIVLCVTDGQPDDQDSLARLIVETTKKMKDDNEIGVSFIQIGKDPGASAFLKKLDDDLVKQGAKFDIVDTKTCEEMENMTITEVLVAALED